MARPCVLAGALWQAQRLEPTSTLPFLRPELVVNRTGPQIVFSIRINFRKNRWVQPSGTL